MSTGPRRTMPPLEFALHREQLEALAFLLHPLDFLRFVGTIDFAEGLPAQLAKLATSKLDPSGSPEAVAALRELGALSYEFRQRTRAPLLRLLAARAAAGDAAASAALDNLAELGTESGRQVAIAAIADLIPPRHSRKGRPS